MGEGQADDPWFAGVITKIEGSVATVLYNDGGEEQGGVREDRLMHCPTVPEYWGKGSDAGQGSRGNDSLPPGCKKAAFPPTVSVQVGHKVVAKWTPYEGQADDPWFAGVITKIEGSVATVLYNDGGEEQGGV